METAGFPQGKHMPTSWVDSKENIDINNGRLECNMIKHNGKRLHVATGIQNTIMGCVI